MANIFEDWLAVSAMLRFHPIPALIREPFDAVTQCAHRRYAALRPQFISGREIDIYTDFIDEGATIARCGFHAGLGLIGISRGWVLLRSDLFYRMLSHPLVLPGFGDASAERILPQHCDGVVKDFDRLVERRRSANRPDYCQAPVCPKRKALAALCADLAMRFIAAHELVHLIQGHARYLGARGNPSEFEKLMSMAFSSEHLDVEDMLDYQALEVCADAVAARGVLYGMLRHSPRMNDYYGITGDREKLAIWVFTLFALFRIIGLGADLSKLNSTKHPPTLMRFGILITDSAKDVAESDPQLNASFVEIVREAQTLCDTAIAYCGGERFPVEHFKLLYDDSMSLRRDRIAQHFDDVIAPKLQSHAHIKLKMLGQTHT